MMKPNPIKQFFIIAFFLSLAIAVTIHFPMVMNYIFGDEIGRGSHRDHENFAHLLSEIGITSVIAMVLFTLNFFILNPAGKHVNLSPYRIITAILLTIVAVYIVSDLLHPIFHGDRDSRPLGRKDEFDYINFFVSGLVIASTLVIRLIFSKQNVMLENEQLLNPGQFFRANRQYIISSTAVKDVDLWFNGRLSINLKINLAEKIIISKARTGEFKKWFGA